jgi:hypothetical protein
VAEATERGQRPGVHRQCQRGLHDRRVPQHLAGRHVAALGDLVPGRPQLAHHGHLPSSPHLVHPRRTPPGILARRGGRGRRDGRELLMGPLQLPLPGQLLLQRVPQVDQQLHIERGVMQPGLGQRSGRPVDGRMPLLQGVAEDVLDHGAEPHPGEPGQPAREFGVEEPVRDHAYVAQTWQILGRGVQHPLGVGDGGAQTRQVGAADGVDQCGPRSGPAQLDQIGPLSVAVAGGALGVDGDGAVARGEGRDDLGERVRVGGDGRNALTRLQQGDRRRGEVVRRSAPGGSQCRLCCGLLGVGHLSRVAVYGGYTGRPSTERSVDGRGVGCRTGDPRRMAQWMMPVRSATATMPARSPVPSLRAMRARWLLTVSADRPIETPMALLDWPSATSLSTSTSRPDSSR